MSFSIIHRQMAHLIHSRGFRHCDSRLSWFLICSRLRRGKKKRVWWEVLGSNGSRHSESIYSKGNLKMGMCRETDHLESRILCNQMEVIRVLLLFITFSHGMDRKLFDSLEIEANALTPTHCTHHLSLRCCHSSQLLNRIEREALDQLEAWQNLWAFPMWYEAAWIPKRFD